MRLLNLAAGNLFGGVETLLTTLARCRALCPQMEPHFGICFEGRLSAELEAAGVPVHRLGSVRISQPWSVFRARARLREVVRREHINCLVCHSSWPHAVFGPVARRAGVPLVLWAHGPFSTRSWLDWWATGTVPDLVLSNSRFTEQKIRAFLPNVPHHWLYYPIVLESSPADPPERAAMRRELDTPTDVPVILQVSRMEPWKGHELHLRALAHLPRHLDWHCWMVGGSQRPEEARYLEALKRQAGLLGIAERVRFLGERHDVPRLLAAADVHCQPNTGPEPFGITFIEALAAGLPVVTTAMGGALELVDETCGRLVPPADQGALARALEGLLTDADLRLRLGQAGQKRAKALCDPGSQLHHLWELLTSSFPGRPQPAPLVPATRETAAP